MQNKGVSAIMESTITRHEAEQKSVVIKKLQNPNLRYPDFLNWMENEIKQSKRMSTFNHSLLCFKSDGVYQLNRAISEVFGVVSAVQKSEGPSGGDAAMNTIEITLATGERMHVPYGDIALEDLGEGSMISISYNDEQHKLYIKGKCQYKYVSLINDIVDKTKELLATESIYKNLALEITDVNNPKIMDLSNIEKERMILSKTVEVALRPLNARIQFPDKCIQQGIPLKYGMLLSGKYGTGKTLVAFKTAVQAIKNNWSFIYLKDPKLLADTIRLCKVIDKTGHGVVIFTEDLDQVARGNRDAAMQDILNTLDGGDTKGMNIITIFTTNHIEAIEPTFLRGKRIGSVVTLNGLDAETAEMFFKDAFDGFTFDGEFNEIYKLIESYEIVPAFMAEIIEAVKSNMLFMEDPNIIKPEYIRSAVESYAHQMGLAKVKDISMTPEKQLAQSLKDVSGYNEIMTKLMEIESEL